MGVTLGLALLLTTLSPEVSGIANTGTLQVEASSVTYSTTDNLNLRSGASTKHKVLVNIPKGKPVTMVSYGASWSKVKYGSNTGFVSTKYLKKTTIQPVPKPAPKPEVKVETIHTTTANLSLRTGASVNHKQILTIPKGKAVKMVSYGTAWSKVTYASKTGFVSTKYLKVTKVEVKPAPKPTPAPAPKPAPAPAKDTFVSMATAEKQLMATVSPIDSISKLYSKGGTHLYVATLMPSTDAQLSARYGVVYFWHDAKKATKLQINTQRYRDNSYLQPNGDLAIQVAADSVFGKGKPGSKQLHDFIKANMNATSDTTKKMTFGGHSATVSVTKWDIQITFN